MRFVLVAKPSSHVALFAQVEEREQRGACEHGMWEEGTGRHRRTFAYRRANDIPLTQSGRGAGQFPGSLGTPSRWHGRAIIIRGSLTLP